MRLVDADALDLINRQNAEIERLKEENINQHNSIGEIIKQTKAEAYKEFARELMLIPRNTVRKDEIKNLLKEKVGDE